MFGLGIQELVLLVFIIYVPICIGKIASKLGRNGVLFRLLFVIPIVNIVMLSILAFAQSGSSVRRN
jgi:hypothetical protein